MVLQTMPYTQEFTQIIKKVATEVGNIIIPTTQLTGIRAMATILKVSIKIFSRNL